MCGSIGAANECGSIGFVKGKMCGSIRPGNGRNVCFNMAVNGQGVRLNRG